MAVSFAKQEVKTKAKAKTEAKVSPVAKTVERMAELEKILRKAKTDQTEYDTLKALLETQIEAGPGEEVVFKGDGHEVVFTACPNVRTISDMEMAKKLLGNDTFMKVAKIGMKDLDTYLTPEELSKVVTESQTGSRRHKIRESA